MTNELLTREDLQHFRTQLLNELKEVLQQSSQTTKQWLKSSEVRKMLGHLTRYIAKLKDQQKPAIHQTRWYHVLQVRGHRKDPGGRIDFQKVLGWKR